MSRRLLAFVSALTLLLSIAGPAAAGSTGDRVSGAAATGELQSETVAVASGGGNALKLAPEGIFLIRLTDAPVASYRGGLRGLDATSPLATGDDRLDLQAAASREYAEYLDIVQGSFTARLEQTIGHEVDVKYTYKNGNNGLAVWLTPEEAVIASAMPGVRYVQPDETRILDTDVGPGFIGAPGIWGSADCSPPGSCGEGIIVGVIDTGINPLNPSFADVGADGYDHANPLGAGNYVGVCDPANTGSGDVKGYDPTFPCNDKLIGAWGYNSVDLANSADSPTDYNGHGSHTASTAAGNFTSATISGGARAPEAIDISGVAPHANIIAYAGCCELSSLTAAIDQAIADGVDVINYSIGANAASNLWDDFDTVGYLAAREAGIFVATSAGNNGPGAETVGSPADAPWLTSVGASTHNRTWVNSVGSFTGGDTVLADITGNAFTDGYGPAPIVYAGDFGNALCAAPFPAGTWTSGEIVVCDRGTVARTDKSANAAAGGAGGMVLANDLANGESINADAHSIPSSHISYADGVALKAWLAAGTGHMATITGGVYTLDAGLADIMAAFSSRGANRAIDLVSPNVTAPGADIIAAHGVSGAVVWDFSSGTSMASPHVAGAAALLMQSNPTWTPAQVQSALMLTATTTVLKEDGTTPAEPFDMGSGRVDVTAADDSGLLMDETIANYTAANPAVGGDPRELNVPSMANSQCVVTCSWTRTITALKAGSWTTSTSVDSGSLTAITVSPSAFTLNLGESQTIEITATVAAPDPAWSFGNVEFFLDGGGTPEAHMPVAVVSTGSNVPSWLVLTGPQDGSYVAEGSQSVVAITDMQTVPEGLAKADLTDASLVQDPTNGNPFDDPTQVLTHLVTAPAGASRLVAEVASSESPDLDMFVGKDLNMDGIATVDELACVSASATALEYCSLSSPSAGQWWVLIQNWNDSAPGAEDAFTLATAVVAGDETNMTVTGPSAVAAGTPFDLTVAWNLPAAVDGDLYYGSFSVGSAAPKTDDVATVLVDLLIGLPAFPAGAELTAMDIYANELTLMWPAAAGSVDADGYGIYQDSVKLASVAPGATSYKVSGLDPSTSYDFGVVAVVSGGESEKLTGSFVTGKDFTDDDSSIFEQDIEWLSSSGITLGCNPPTNDEYCPDDTITRGQLAAMMSRAFDLPAATDDHFTDDDLSIFEDDINRLAEAGITFGCNPPTNDSYCPEEQLSRGQLAAMLDRALDLALTSTDFFTDDDGSIFQPSINRLAAAGITRGCNPPANDNFCPNDTVTRGQIAAFLHRALG